MRAEKIFQNPLATQDRRCPVGVRRRQLEASLSQQPAPHIKVRVELHPAELASVNIRNSVVHGKTLVDERVIRCQQFEHGPAFAQNAIEKHLGFRAHGLAQVIVEIRINRSFRGFILQRSQTEPLSGEILDQFLRARVRQHPFHLLLEHVGLFQFSLSGKVDQFLVWEIAPQKERQARRQLEVADPISFAWFNTGGRGLRPEDKFRVRQNELKRFFDTVLEIAGLPADVIEIHECAEVGLGERSAICLAG